MRLLRGKSIRGKLALTLWGAALLAFCVAGAGLVLFQNLTLEQRARQIMEPYAQLVAVGTDAAVAFEDPLRAQEILETLRANPQVIEADIFLADGRQLASFSRQQGTKPRALAARADGIYLHSTTAELLQGLPRGARLQLRMGLEQLSAQTQQALWMFGAAMLFVLTVTLVQLAVLQRTIVKPIATLTETAELVRTRTDYPQHIPVAGDDEVARLGRSFNAMLDAIHLREDELRRLTDFQRTILDNAAYCIISATPDGVVTSFNPAAERLLGYAADEVIGKLTPACWHDPGEVEQHAHRLSKELGETIQPGFEVFAARARRNLPEEREWTYVRKDGRRIPVYLSVTALRDENDEVVGLVGLSYDLTERKQAELALHRLNRELRAISDCNQILVRAEDEQSLLDDICRIICDKAGYRMAWVGFVQLGEHTTMRVAASAGAELGYLEVAFAIRDATGQADAPTEIAARTGEITGFDDVASDPTAAPWRAAALQRGYRSSISLPLKDKSRTFGVLTIYAAEAHAFTPEERRLLGELADDLAFGIVTLRTRAEHSLAEEQIQIAATAFEAQEGIVITDAAQVILRVNRAFTDITGYAAAEVVGKTPRLLSSGHHDAAYYRTMWNHIHGDGSWQGEIWNRRKSGDLYPEWLNITAVRNAQGQVTHYVGTMIDITERKEAERKIEHLAFYDLLTGLPNRRLFIDRLQQAMGGSARSRRMGALLFIDLDNFKIVNDTCGHDVGDRLLIEVARRLDSCVRDGDTISRLGGDEFVAMLEDLSDQPQEAAAQARIVAAKVLETLNQPYAIAGRVHHSTPSIGATIFVGNQDSVDELLKQADIAMYQAKSAGRNTLRFFDPEMQAAVAARASLETDLRQGIGGREFVLHYQPQVDGNRRVIGAEALLRWQHPGRGMIPPAQFIPLAEETGLILAIGQWVLEEACARLTDWSRDAARCHLNLAVNVSARQFRQPDFVARVRQALADARAPAAHLKLELTETLVLDNVEDTIDKMQALKELGVGFSMDDFGTGYSSLSYLTRLPLDQLKIDQSFVRKLPDSATDAVVVQSIITLAESLGITVIAEGVETETQRVFLEQHGCPVYQGYLFSKPVPLADFEALLQAGA
ncbi:MAG: EAL domain-containing protein [Rhodocyclales bacterium]|nr:EAL domain-containing protein [Rhodocyclales bacterium]